MTKENFEMQKVEEVENNFKKLKAIDWQNSTASFYVVQRKLSNKKASYEVLLVNIDDTFQKKMIENINKKINSSNEAQEYDFNTIDLDNNVLEIPAKDTDFKEILEIINSNPSPEMASSYKSLMGSWMYVARLDNKNDVLYSARKISTNWSAKRVSKNWQLAWKDNMLIDVEEDKVFAIDNTIDFFSFNDCIFIANKKNFESALNFRQGMINNREEIVGDFKTLELFVNADEISQLVGENMRRLRALSQVKKAGYYKDADFLTKLKKINIDENWGIKYSDDGKLEVTEDDIDTILTVLNNSRLKSPINDETFDAGVKQKIDAPNQTI